MSVALLTSQTLDDATLDEMVLSVVVPRVVRIRPAARVGTAKVAAHAVTEEASARALMELIADVL
jgi:hypothetical protein